eukprot:s98_g2.t1
MGPIRCAIAAQGTRGDFQPVLALGLGLVRAGHVVKFFANPGHCKMAAEFGIESLACSMEIKDFLATERGMKAMETGDILMVMAASDYDDDVDLNIDYGEIFVKGMLEFKPDIIIWTGLIGGEVARFRQHTNFTVPEICASYQPHAIPTNHISPVHMQRLELEPGQPMLYTWVLQAQTEAMNNFTACQEEMKQGKEPFMFHTPQAQYEGYFGEDNPTPKLLAYSPGWWPAYDDWPTGDNKGYVITGNWKISKEVQEEAAKKGSTLFNAGSQHEACTKFIESGEKPVYIGWGSMMVYSKTAAWLADGRSIWSVGKPQGSVDVIEEGGGEFDGYGKPVLLKNAARTGPGQFDPQVMWLHSAGRSMPAFQNWSDEYLMAKYGDTVLDQAWIGRGVCNFGVVICMPRSGSFKLKSRALHLPVTIIGQRKAQPTECRASRKRARRGDRMDDDAASGHSGHVLSYFGGLSGSDEEDIENQLPFGHVASDGSGDVDDPASSSESSGDEDPMQAEGSMMEEVRALAEYAMPSDLVGHPLTGAMSPPAPIGANDGIDNHTSAALAKAAMLMPVSMDLYSEPDTPKYLVGLRRGILTMITLFVLITCASMHFVLEIYTASMRAEIISACSDALSLQNLGTDEIVYENITSEKMKQVLGSMTQSLSVSIQTPADRALESIWGSLRTMHDGPFASDDMAVSDSCLHVYRDVKLPTNQLKSIAIIRNSGDVIGMAGSFYTVTCPRAGPAVCGSCVGECKDLDVHAFGSLEGPHGKQLVSRKVNLSTGLPVGQPLLVEPLEWRERAEYQVQKQAAQEAGASSISRRWSRIHHRSKGALRMCWTQPLAYCGSYSCFDGVISAEVLLDHISHECKSGLSLLNGMTRPDAIVTAANASIFVVNHVSQHRDQSHGRSSAFLKRDYLPRNATDLQTHEPEQEMVAATARAVFAKFGAWDAEALLAPQELSFRKSYALKGEFVECGFQRINYDFADGQDMDCLQVATKSVEFDKFTRWLIVTAVSDGAFNAHALAAQQGAFAMLESIDSITQTSMNQARIAAAVIFFTVGFVALLIGALLAWGISEPVSRLSTDIQQMDEYNGILPEFIIPAARGFAIKDVAEAQRAFRDLVSERCCDLVPWCSKNGLVQT